MPSCDQCWKDAHGGNVDIVDRYQSLIATHACTPEQQAGDEAEECPKCGRMTLHQYAHICMACGHDESEAGDE